MNVASTNETTFKLALLRSEEITLPGVVLLGVEYNGAAGRKESFFDKSPSYCILSIQTCFQMSLLVITKKHAFFLKTSFFRRKECAIEGKSGLEIIYHTIFVLVHSPDRAKD